MTPVVFDFWSPPCAPCRAFRPTFEAWAEKHADLAEWQAVNVFTDDGQALAVKYGVAVVPTVIVTMAGRVVAKFVGAPKEADVLTALREAACGGQRSHV